MADRDFDIEENVSSLGVKLNIPIFLKGRQQLSHHELVEIQCIASKEFM